MKNFTIEGAVFSVPMFFKKNLDVDIISLEKYLRKCLSIKSIEVIYAMAYNTRFRQLSNNEIL